MDSYPPYGEWDTVTHTWYLIDSEGTPQPWSMDDMLAGVEYVETNRTFTLTVDEQTQATTLTVKHTFIRADMA